MSGYKNIYFCFIKQVELKYIVILISMHIHWLYRYYICKNYPFSKFECGGSNSTNFYQETNTERSLTHVMSFDPPFDIPCILRKILNTFSFQYTVIFQKRKSLEPPSSTPGVDGNKC